MNEINSTPQIQQSGTPQTKPVQQQNKPVQFNVNGSIFGDRDGSVDDNGRATITYADFDDALLNQTNGEHTFKEYIGALIGRAWETAGNFLKNIFMIFNKEGQVPEIDGVKVGTIEGDKVLGHDGKWYKFGDEYEYNGKRYMIADEGANITMDQDTEEHFNPDGTYSQIITIDGEKTETIFSKYDPQLRVGVRQSMQVTYDNGAGTRIEYDENGKRERTMHLRYDNAHLPRYQEIINKSIDK